MLRNYPHLKKPIFKKEEPKPMTINDGLAVYLLVYIDQAHDFFLLGKEDETITSTINRKDIKPPVRKLLEWAMNEKKCNNMAEVLKLSMYEVFYKAMEFGAVLRIPKTILKHSEEEYKKIGIIECDE